ncbi:Glycogen phosphorylase, partial [hydrothermal vent metagenome]
ATYRLKQEIVLGIGGVRVLHALGFEIHKYHMNEGHSALLGLELLQQHEYPSGDLRPGESAYNLPMVREMCSFTTHTPVEAGHDQFSYDLVGKILDPVFDLETLKHLAGDESLSMTRLALNLSEHINGVAKRHAEISRKMFPGYQVKAITNGVHPHTWTSASFIALYDHHLPAWCHEPELLVRADCCISDAAILQAHRQAKIALLETIKSLTGTVFDLEMPTFGFARRMTAYKRPDLLFSDLERLKGIAQKQPFQIVLAGKAHPNDEGGKELIEKLHRHIHELEGIITMVFLPGYNMEIARLMVAGVDVWLNTPLRPMEASGTSGMKAAFNGVPNLSVLDGWWLEGCIEGITGWSVGEDGAASGDGDDAAALYDKLEEVVLPRYANPSEWVKVMKGAICKNASFFNSHRMMRRYATEAYIR